MQRMTVKAATLTATERGEFTAVVSTVNVDREGDVVDPSGMVRALRRWIPTGKRIPLSWQHSTAAEDVIGHVDPGSAIESGGEVIADGWIDQSTGRGKQAWRLVKSGTLGFSYGYIPLKATRRPTGRNITELDVFEITATPIPMNADTRVVGWKSVQDYGAGEIVDGDEQRERAKALEREFAPVTIARFDA